MSFMTEPTDSGARDRERLAATIARALGIAASALDPHTAFHRYGLDSVGAVKLAAELAAQGMPRPCTPILFWEHPTLAQLAAYFAGEAVAAIGDDAVAGSIGAPSGGAPGADEPIAVVGMACRFPGAPDLGAYWALLAGGVDAVGAVPAARWRPRSPDVERELAAGAALEQGGFIDGVDQLDAAFFGVSPREAALMDPQQRLMLELSWAALEDAGIAPAALRGTATGVFTGAMWSDYETLVRRAGAAGRQVHTSSGVHRSILANRVSYALGLHGPSVCVDTACSSGLVAVHLACESLRRGESTLALAGAVNLMLVAESTLEASRLGALSPDGRCFAFDDRANGYVRGEGAGVVVLKPLARAIADGDLVYCVVRGSAVNNDGASNGLTAPSAQAQEAVVRAACARGGVATADVDYVEAHGTGTQLGDPIEARALSNVLCAGRGADRPLRVGSVKTNIGHLEGAAGIAGFIKVALAIQHRAIPASLHFARPNPNIPFADWRLTVPTALAAWTSPDDRLTAGVSSFGFGGTNAHVVVQSAPAGRAELITLAAASASALAAEVAAVDAALAAGAALTAIPRAPAGSHRVAVVGRSAGEVRALLAGFGRGERQPGLRAIGPDGAPAGGGPVLVFSGQGKQHPGMGASLLATEPAFRAAIEACDAAVHRILGSSVVDELRAPASASRLDDIAVVFPTLVALEIGLAALWRSWGVQPSAVVGYSFGEIAAAQAAGVLSTDDAMLVACHQGRLARTTRGRAGMMLVALSWDATAAAIAASGAAAFPAIANAATSTVVAGEPAALAALAGHLDGRDVWHRRVDMDVAPHSPFVHGLADEYRAAIAGIRPGPARIPFMAARTARWLEGDDAGPEHWVRQLVEPVPFAAMVSRLGALGHDTFVEVGPNPLVGRAIEETLRGEGRAATVLPSLVAGQDDRTTLLEALGGLHVAGAGPDGDGPVPLVLSGRDDAALRAQAARLRDHLEVHPALPLVDVAATLATRRGHLARRAALIAGDRDAALAGLAAIAGGGSSPRAVVGDAAAQGGLTFVFPGQGARWNGMARALLASSPVFRAEMAACERALAAHVPWSLRAVVAGDAGAPSLDRVDVLQPALFSIMVSLAAVWRSLGVAPTAVVGHSQGEVAAACVAGALSLADAVQVVAVRSRLLARLSGAGAMVAVELGAAELAPYLAPFGDRLAIAAINSPHATTLAGEPAAVDALIEVLSNAQIYAVKSGGDHASHWARVDVLADELTAGLAGIAPRSATIPIASTVTGGLVDGAAMDAGYWYRNLRQTVRFEEATRALVAVGQRAFVEVSPHPVLNLALHATLEAADVEPVVVGTLRRNDGDLDRLLLSLGELHIRGAAIDWSALFAPRRPRPVRLPTYAFQRERHWIDGGGRGADVAAAGLASAEHPLLGAAVALADGGHLFTARLALADHPWLAGHEVLGQVIVPGTALLEMALAAAHRVGLDRVDELALEAPLVLPATGAVLLQLALAADADGRRELTLHGRLDEGGDDAAWTCHARGQLAADASAPGFDLRAWPPAGAEPLAVDGLYPRLAGAGLVYGGLFQGLRAAWKRGAELFAEVALADAGAATGYGAHPALLDAALHALMIDRAQGGAVELVMPFSWSGVRLHAVAATALRVRLDATAPANVAIEVADAAGAPVATIDGLALRPASLSAVAVRPDALFRVDWSELPEEPAPRSATWVRLGDGAALDGGLEGYRDLAALGAALDQGLACPDVVVAPFAAGAARELPAAAHDAAAAALALIQAWLADERLAGAALVVLTRRAIATRGDEDVVDLAHAPIWGLVRAAQTENPDRAIHLIDVDDSDASRRTLRSAFSAGAPQLALRAGRRLVPRLARPRGDDALVMPAAPAWRLDIPVKGTLESLALVPHPAASAALAPGQVRVAVRAAGLNFRDVFDALGMMPVDRNLPLGSEGAGVVVEVGPAVAGLAAGDRVFGMLDGAFGPLAIADARALARVPARWSFAEAASIPVVFLTAYYALVDLARLQRGQRVLIHAGAGGVGTAAIQIARHLGAEVFATASPGKWDALRALGVDDAHIASSRSADFEASVRRETHGRGVDVVLNSLARELVDASLRVTVAGGHFLEMGKSDVRDPAAVAARHPGVAYRAFDLFDAGPERIRAMLGELLALFERGALRPPPLTACDVRRAPHAFRGLAQARHVGKLILTIPRRLDADGTVLITGGTGTLGGLVARHLVRRHGARHLLLVSRQGAAAVGADALQRELAAGGATVTIAACDAADRGALAALLATIPGAHPLRAVIHMAAALDDGVVTGLDAARLGAVLRPKLDAAVHLHELTAGLDLDAFVLFSSIAGVLDSPGQGSYAAANAFLDALAQHRASRGLPAVALAWGWWAQRSALGAHLGDADLRRIERGGVRGLGSEEGLALLDAALAGTDPAVVPAAFSLPALRALAAPSPLLHGLVKPATARPLAAGATAATLGQRLAALPAAERERALLDIVRGEVRVVLGLPPATTIDAGRPLSELGLDSLMAVELRNRFAAHAGLRLPATLLFDCPTPRALAGSLLERLAVAPVPRGDDVDRLERALVDAWAREDLRDELSARLAGLLARWSHERAPAGELAQQLAAATDDDELFRMIDAVRAGGGT
jgi:acyl transferase domain-containing protein/NADPH:quinone reductase-like Zn-dependent oxidoreductase/acyl carrier protein